MQSPCPLERFHEKINPDSVLDSAVATGFGRLGQCRLGQLTGSAWRSRFLAWHPVHLFDKEDRWEQNAYALRPYSYLPLGGALNGGARPDQKRICVVIGIAVASHSSLVRPGQR